MNTVEHNLHEPRRRRDAWLVPSRATAIRFGAVGLALIVVTTAIEVMVHGLDVESWGAVSGSALVLVPAWAGVVLLARYRRDRRLEWLLLSLGSFGWAFGQLLWIAQITLNGSTTWPSFADIGYLAFPVGAIGAIVVHTRPFERTTRLVFMVDALVLSVALSFIAWELIIRAGVGDPARFSLAAQLAMLIYPLTDIALATMLGLMMLIGRSPARIGLFVGAVLNVGLAIPSSPGFVGTYQWLIVAGLGLFAVGATQAFAFSVLLQLTWFVPQTVVGLILLPRLGMTFRALRHTGASQVV